MNRLAIRLACAVGVALSLTACAADGESVPSTATQAVAQALAAAAQGHPSAEQIDVLERAAREGRDVTFEEARAAIDEQLACMTESGFAILNVTEYEVGPVIEVSYEYSIGSLSEDQAIAIEGECSDTHSSYVLWAYLGQSAVDEWQTATILGYAPAMRECLASRGVELAVDATVDEILATNIEAGLDSDGNGCMQTTGLDYALSP